jgi:hypothetical protein
MASKEPLRSLHGGIPTKCARRAKLNRATVNGLDYEISDANRDAIIADFLTVLNNTLNEDAFAAKWAHVCIGPMDVRNPIDNSANDV